MWKAGTLSRYHTSSNLIPRHGFGAWPSPVFTTGCPSVSLSSGNLAIDGNHHRHKSRGAEKRNNCMTDLSEALAKYEFYHIIDLGNGHKTKGYPSLVPVQAPVLDAIGSIDMAGKSVLDVGCRDGLFCFAAERRGASRIVGIDNILSRGAVEVLIPHFNSKVQMREVNLYDFASDERFDVAIFAGVLYH